MKWDGAFDVVGEAANGREAIEVVRATQPDVVVLDLEMPVMDGLRAIPRILGESPRTRVVVLTGVDAPDVEEEVLALGASALLCKGVRSAVLTATLHEVCDNRGG